MRLHQPETHARTHTCTHTRARGNAHTTHARAHTHTHAHTTHTRARVHPYAELLPLVSRVGIPLFGVCVRALHTRVRACGRYTRACVCSTSIRHVRCGHQSYAHARARACVCVCVCVRTRVRARARARVCVCVCLFVCLSITCPPVTQQRIQSSHRLCALVFVAGMPTHMVPNPRPGLNFIHNPTLTQARTKV